MNRIKQQGIGKQIQKIINLGVEKVALSSGSMPFSVELDITGIIRIDPRYFRPTEVASLLGDPTKAKEKLGWVPEITLDELVQEMVASDLVDAKKHALLKQHGYQVAVSAE